MSSWGSEDVNAAALYTWWVSSIYIRGISSYVELPAIRYTVVMATSPQLHRPCLIFKIYDNGVICSEYHFTVHFSVSERQALCRPSKFACLPQYCYPRINTGYPSYQSITNVALQSKIPCLLCSPWYHKACLVCLFNTYTTNLSQIICKTTVSLLIELLIWRSHNIWLLLFRLCSTQ